MNVFLIITSSLLLGAPNPVLPGVADVGVFRHAGVYYLMGVLRAVSTPRMTSCTGAGRFMRFP